MKNKSINRRRFLKRAAGTAVGAIGFPYLIRSSALGKAGTIAPSNRIVMGAIGVGSQGTSDMKGFLSKSEVQMVAVCDVDRKHRNRAKQIVNTKYQNSDCRTYLDFRDLIGRGDLDAVCLALPDHWHGIISVAAARAGLDIHGQKPLARTIVEGRAICDAVKRYGVVWQTGSQHAPAETFITPVNWSATDGWAKSTGSMWDCRPAKVATHNPRCLFRRVWTGICGWGRHPGDHFVISDGEAVTWIGAG